MKLFPILRPVALPVSILTVCALCYNLPAAEYGSLRGNNRSSGPSQPAQHQQPQESRQPEIRQPQPEARPEQRPEQRPQDHPEQREVPQRPDEHFQPAPEQVDRARAEAADTRRQDIAPERQQSYFWSDYHRGMNIDRLPGGYRRIGLRGHNYFYFGGVFYDNGPSGYVVIAPRVDAEIPDLPPGAETVVVGSSIYYYAAGAFYLQQPDGGYLVVAPPMGAVVSLLPPDATESDVNGIAYYVADGVYYLPVMQNGVTAFEIVPQP
jgi:hypothetical protein